MTNEEISKFISTFKTEDRWEGPTVIGLERALRENVKSNPEKYYSNFMPFISSAYIYIYGILNGFLDAWKVKKFINWDNILDFMFKYIDINEFWSDAFVIDDDDWHVNHKWIIGAVADLISEGTKDDKWAMGYEQVKKAKEMTLLILDKVIN